MKSKIWPDYNNSIVNLMSSILASFKVKNFYKPLTFLPASKLKAKNIVLLEVDGLGLSILKKHSPHGLLAQNLWGTVTSIFPSTTAAISVTFASGVAPQQHAILSWFMNLKEIGAAIQPLPFCFRGSNLSLRQIIEPKQLFDFVPISSKLKNSFFIINQKLVASDFTRCAAKGAKKIGFRNLKGLFAMILQAVNSRGKKYVYAYWDKIDALSHEFGPESKEVKKALKELEQQLEGFLEKVKGKEVILIVTADHGIIATPRKCSINLNEQKEFYDCLALPVAGDGRNAFCWVKPSKVKEFKQIINTQFKDICELYEAQQLIKQGRFGLGKPNPKLVDRVGDFVLISKNNYQFRDFLLNEKVHFHLGQHGGLSKEEMLVPVVLFET